VRCLQCSKLAAAAGATSILPLVLYSCGDVPTVPPEPARLEVVSNTTGLPQLGGYTVTLNGELSRQLDNNGSVMYTDLEAGEYVLELSGLTPDCLVLGKNPRVLILAAGRTSETLFQVRCIPPNTGTVVVRAATYGNGPTRYEVILDNGLYVKTLPNDETVTFFPVPIGIRSVELVGVPPDCGLNGPNPRFISLNEPGSIVGTVFKMNCPL
jgi:hypothetical protein